MAAEVVALIQPGDCVHWQTDAASGQGEAWGKPAPNCWNSHYVSVFDGEVATPIDTAIITRVERAGELVWPPEVVQLSFL